MPRLRTRLSAAAKRCAISAGAEFGERFQQPRPVRPPLAVGADEFVGNAGQRRVALGPGGDLHSGRARFFGGAGARGHGYSKLFSPGRSRRRALFDAVWLLLLFCARHVAAAKWIPPPPGRARERPPA